MTLRGLVPKTKTFAGAFGPFGVACLFTALSPVLGFTPGVGALVGGLTAFSSSEMIRWGAKPPRGRRKTRNLWKFLKSPTTTSRAVCTAERLATDPATFLLPRRFISRWYRGRCRNGSS